MLSVSQLTTRGFITVWMSRCRRVQYSSCRQRQMLCDYMCNSVSIRANPLGGTTQFRTIRCTPLYQCVCIWYKYAYLLQVYSYCQRMCLSRATAYTLLALLGLQLGLYYLAYHKQLLHLFRPMVERRYKNLWTNQNYTSVQSELSGIMVNQILTCWTQVFLQHF